jgi:hypothetical protein
MVQYEDTHISRNEATLKTSRPKGASGSLERSLGERGEAAGAKPSAMTVRSYHPRLQDTIHVRPRRQELHGYESRDGRQRAFGDNSFLHLLSRRRKREGEETNKK